MNFRKFALCLIGLFCIAASHLCAQTRDTGREVMRGEMNFTALAAYYVLHPEPAVRKEVENDDDDEARPFTVRAITDSSMIHRRTTSSFAPSAPVSGGSAFLPISPAPNDTFESTLDNNTTIPPDTHGAVDSNYCMTVINSSVRIQTRAGTTISTVSLDAFFTPVVTTGTVYDPRVHYDPSVHRWIFVADYGPEATTSSILIAISETSNPTGSWYEFKILADPTGVNWLDFPEVGFNGKWIAVTGNLFTVAASDFTAPKIFMFNKANLIAGTSATYTAISQGNFTICPTLTYDTSEKSMFFIEDWNAGAGALRLSKVTGAVGAETWTAVGFPVTAQAWQEESFQNTGTGGADFAPQTGTDSLVQTNDDRIDQMTDMNGKLWFAHTIFLPYSTTANPTRSSIQWWEIDTLANIVQLGNIDDATGANFYAFPSLAVNTSNDVLIGFAAYSAASHPSGAYAVRMHTDPTDSIRPLQVFRHGQNAYYKNYGGTKNRWGDYSGAVMDPLNQTDFWTIQEASAATVNEWDTWWAQVILCTAPVGITGTLTVCPGAATTLADVTTGGTWTSSSTATATVGSTTGIVTGVASGTVTISYSTGASCFSVSTVTVSAAPVAIAGNAPVCAGSVVTLTDATTGGSWASGTATVATVGTGAGAVTGVASGTSIISYTLISNGCRATGIVTVNPLPGAISASSPFCAGSTITLTDGTTGGTWASGSTGVATVVSGTGVVSGVSGGTAIITYALGTGCSVTTIVTVNPSPSGIAGPGTVCAGSTITLGEVTTGGTWASSTAAAATVGTTGIVSGVAAGTTTISYTLASGCRATTIVTVNALPSAIGGNAPVCAGSTITLTDGGGGTWLSGNTAAATITSGGVVTGVASGTSIITYTLTGCTATAIVTVNALPSAIGSNAPVCAGSTVTLTDGGGGTWLSGNTAAATITGGGVVTGVASGTSIITYTLTGCTATAIVTVNPLPSAIGGNAPVCAGSTITLTDGGGGTWLSGNTAAATITSGGVVSGVASGTSVITYTLGTGCSITAIVTVNTSPAAIGGNAPVCAGSTITLTDGGGGTWLSGNTAVATVTAGGVVTGVSSGTSVITYTLGTCTTTVIVTVNPLPSAIGGNAPVCAGSTITLTDGGGGTWVSDNVSVATVASGTGIVTGVSSGTAIITYTLGTGCAATIVVTANSLPPAIGGNAPVCAGSTVTLTDGGGGTWLSGNTATATVTAGGVVTGVASGTSIITYTLTGCTATAVVTVNPLPSAIGGNVPVCAGSTITLTDGGGGTWLSGNTAVATITSGGVVTGVASGTSIITYTLGTGCTAIAVVTVNISPSAISGASAVCAGTTTTLTDVITGGTWASSNTSAATVVAGTGVVTGVASGTTTITYTLGSGCKATTVVTVNSVPSAIGGNAPVCAASTITLTDGGGGTWLSGNTAVATVTSGGVVTGVTFGTSIITYSLGTGCTVTAIVTVNPLPSAIGGNAPVCAGSTITLTDGGGGTWVSGNTAAATVTSGGVVTGVASGTSIITYTLGTGCTATVVVTANSLPSAIGGNAPVCVASTITLTDGGGGTWVSGNTAVATVTSGGIVTGVSSGTSIITYSLGTGCTVTTVVTVNPLPSAIGGNAPVCAGSTITLTDGGGGTWLSGNTAAATITAGGVVTGVASGTSIITYTLGTGCTATVVVTANSLPSAIAGSVPVCAGSTITLTDGGGGTWLSGNTAVATVTAGGVVTGVSFGTSIITYSLGTGCTVTAIVTVNPLPSAIGGNAPVCAGSTITLTDGGGGTWLSGNTAAATVTAGGIVTGVATGTSIITYTLGTGCTATVVVTANSLPSAIGGNVPVCAASTITLTDGGGGTWVSGTTAAATITAGGIVTGVSSGTSIITYTLGTGCATTAIVTVNPLPSAITGSVPVCAGATITLTDGGGGTWESDNPAAATVVAGSGLVTGVSSGTAIITYTLGTGCTATTIVTANALPSAIGGNAPVCVASSVTLTDGGGGTWLSGNTTVATVTSGGIVTGASSGTSVITYTLGTGCATTVTATVNPLPTAIGGNVPVCVASTITLSDGGGGTWLSGNTAVATVTAGGVVTGVLSGTSTITYTLGTGCTTTVIVTVNPLPSAIGGPTAVCIGTTATLTDGGGGTWLSGNTAAATVVAGTGVVTGVAPGTAIITYILSTGCIATSVMSVNSLPSAIAGSVPVCAGSAITLTDGGGGTWVSGNTAVATVVAGTGVVTGVAAGTAVITYIIGTGCTATAVVTVNALPSAIGGSVPVCTGSAITLTDGGGGTWLSGNTAVATVVAGTGVVTGVSSGTSIITYTLGTGCTTTAIVTVNPLPSAITGSVPVCAGSTITLADGGGGTWLSGNTAVATVAAGTGIVRGVSSGTAIITYTLGTGCTTTVIVTVNPLPSAITGSVPVCAGSTITLTGGGGGTWASGNTAVATVTAGGIVTGVTPGASIITYTLGTGCTATVIVTVNITPGAITGGTIVCTGSTRALSDGTTGGTWSSSATATATIAATGVVTGAATGITTVTYTLSDGCFATSAITDDAPPSAITGGTSVCMGSTRALADATTGGTWSSSAAGTATVGTTGIVSSVATGAATITYTLGSGCFAVLPVTVYPLPAGITGPSSVCTGSAIALADITTGGTWSSFATGTATVTGTGAVTGAASGTVVITYTLGTGCFVTATVTDNSLPAAISGPANVCAGAAITLTDATTGGTWSSGNISVATAVAATGVITGFTPGTATVTYTAATGCTATKTITVNALPSAITGTTVICTGATTTLADAGGGTWSSSNTSVVSVGTATGVITGGALPGTATITYTLSTGCSTTVTVTVNAVPTAITGPATVCAGATITLSDAGSGTWSSSPATVATVVTGTGVVTGVIPGTAIITYSVASGCSASETITVNALPAAITGTSGVCMGLTTTLADATSGGAWSSGNTAIATITPASGIVSGITADTVTIAYTAVTGCITAKVVTVNALPAAISAATAIVCTGQTISLTDAGGGTWTSGSTGIATVTASGGVVTGVIPGTATITYTLPTGCTATIVITVNATPSAISGAASVCPGTTVTLTDITSGGTWSSAGTTVTVDAVAGNVTGITAGTALITYTAGSCIITRIITVNPVSVITGVSTVCAGSATTLSATIGGGTWSSGGTGIATVTASTGVVSGVAPGAAAITYTLPTGCVTMTTVTVNALPSPIPGPLHVCQGATITLTDALTGGTWASLSPGIASIGAVSGVVTSAVPGTAIVTYSLLGCTVIATVTVNPAATAITGTSAVCQGLAVTLTDAGGGTWVSGNSAVATIGTGSGVVTGVVPGTSAVTYTLPTGCSATTVVTVNLAPAAVFGLSDVCLGSTITLTDITTGGAWSSVSATVTVDAVSGNVTGIAAGAAVVTYTLGSCTAAMAVTVNPVSPITGAGSVCAGSSITLTDAVSGGTWSAAGAATIIPATGVVTGTTPGTASITYTLPTGCTSTATVTVNALPASITGIGVVCVGSVSVLLDVSAPGSWSSSNTAIANISPVTGSFIGVAAGTAIITYANSMGCITTTTITVNPLPLSITAAGDVCVGLTVALTDAGGGTWSSSNTAVIAIDGVTGLATAVSAGSAVITYTLADGCKATAGIAVDPLPSAITGIDSVCVGASVTLSNAGTGNWTTSDETVATIDPITGIVSGLSAGTAMITYTLTTGCFTVVTVTVTVCPGSSVKQIIAGGGITVLPNPNKGEFVVSGSLNTIADEEVSLEITDILGQVVYQTKVTAINGKLSKQVKLNSAVANGIYILSLHSVTDNKVFHIVVEQ